MPHHDDLLALARQMVDRNPGGRKVEAELPRAVSTAYYALFHLLIARGDGPPGQRRRDSPPRGEDFRSQHNEKGVSRVRRRHGSRRGAKTERKGRGSFSRRHCITSRPLSSTFKEARIQADYNLVAGVPHAQAAADVGRVETAFKDWLLVGAHPAADDFLSELWCRGIPKRN